MEKTREEKWNILVNDCKYLLLFEKTCLNIWKCHHINTLNVCLCVYWLWRIYYKRKLLSKGEFRDQQKFSRKAKNRKKRKIKTRKLLQGHCMKKIYYIFNIKKKIFMNILLALTYVFNSILLFFSFHFVFFFFFVFLIFFCVVLLLVRNNYVLFIFGM